MGVDFDINVVGKKKNGEIEHVFIESLPHLSPRYHQYWPLFEENHKKLEELGGQKLDFDFYKKADGSAYGDYTNKNIIFEPKKVKETILFVLKILNEHPDDFPFYYWICFGGKLNCTGSEEVYIDDQKVYIRGEWDECYYEINSRKVDLKNQKLIDPVYRVKFKKFDDKWVYYKGEKTIINIKKQSFYEYYDPTLKEIVTICDYAIKQNYHIQGYLC